MSEKHSTAFVRASDLPHRKESRGTRLHARLPYGLWTCADGREVLFNRGYRPIWSRVGKGPAQPCAFEWVRFRTQEHFFDDGNPPWCSPATLSKCERILGMFIAGERLTKEIEEYKVRRARRTGFSAREGTSK